MEEEIGLEASIKRKDSGDNTHENIKDFDDVLEVVGSVGKYQRWLLYGILSPLTVFEFIFAINLWFLMDEPKHWCRVPGREDAGLDLETWRNLTVPRELDGDFSKCEVYGSNHSLVPCTTGWEYDFNSTDYKSILTDYNWVCERSHWATWVLTAGNAGRALGTFTLGYLADRIGRKPVFIITLVLYSFGRGISLYFADNIWIFVALALVSGMSAPMFAISLNTIGVELSGKEYRAWIYSFTWMTVVIGLPVVPIIALMVPNWFILGWITILIGSLSYLFIPWIPESPRWLLSMGKIDEVVKILRKIADFNGSSSRASNEELKEMLQKVAMNNDTVEETGIKSAVKLFSKKRVALHTFLITFTWVMNGLVFHGLNLHSLNLEGHRYLNLFLVILMELPGGFAGGVLSDKFGRRWSQVTFFLVCGVFCAIGAVFSYSSGIAVEKSTATVAVIVAANVAKIASTMSFLVIYLQSMEIFPTPFRTTGSGLASTTSSIVIILVPYIVYTGKSSVTTPWVISALISFCGMVSASAIPETINCKLPETLEEAEHFGKGRQFWSFRISEGKEQ